MAQAQVTFTCTAGKNFGQGEGIDKLFDGNTGTKYCNATMPAATAMHSSQPLSLSMYGATT